MSEETIVTEQQPSCAAAPYAGFWLRAGAFILDCIFISIPVWIISVPVLGYAVFKLAPLLEQTSQTQEISPEAVQAFLVLYGLGFLLQIVWVILFWLYFALLESGEKQATWGKRITGIYVTDTDGKRLPFARASGRAFAKFLSYATIYIGFMMAGWTRKKQALHDFIAGTLVVKRQ